MHCTSLLSLFLAVGSAVGSPTISCSSRYTSAKSTGVRTVGYFGNWVCGKDSNHGLVNELMSSPGHLWPQFQGHRHPGHPTNSCRLLLHEHQYHNGRSVLNCFSHQKIPSNRLLVSSPMNGPTSKYPTQATTPPKTEPTSTAESSNSTSSKRPTALSKP